jgi:ketosteroid isomerase-like protein
MKKLIFPFVAILFIAACNSGQKVRYASSSPEIDAFKSSIKHYLEQDWDAYRLHYSDTAKFRNNVPRDKQISLDAAIAKWQEEHEMFSSIHYVATEDYFEVVLTDDDETWVNFWGLWSAVLNANGQKFEIPVHVTAKFEKGKIVEEHGFWDSAPIALVLRDLGIGNE